MVKVQFRQKAIDDLNSIWNYTAHKWSEEQADRYYNMIKMACNDIRPNYEIGKEYERIREGLFGVRTGKHIVFYRQVSKERMEALRILHSRMDLKIRLSE